MDLGKLCDRRAGDVQTALRVLRVLRVLSVGCDQMNIDWLRTINALTALVRAHDRYRCLQAAERNSDQD